ncbi:Homeodomain-like domain-containing protein [Devosia enhydra]|uniref:Homeodomain-like domain-containing protein n=1 Tax=Devosia enhydra TaxID=665118 RepID=A0A1K2I0Y8_9HYPH|nr:helix-turn-helix domain-containing protein [Devosia enhydra]SFZ85984.1 Homeodomain-like domain-containing protein [Devosia enhydra]
MSDRPPPLPPVLAEIAAVAGVDAAWALARAKGGTTVFLPRRAGHRHWLTEIVGQEAADKICRHYRTNHQSRLTIPLAAAAMKSERWTEALRSDMSLTETARAMGVHERTVTNWRRRARGKNGGQGTLF